jgi:hypothetical protein
MPRTATDVDYTDQIATNIGYVSPPVHLEPTGPVGEDPTWSDLVDWYRGQEIPWASAVEVYVSRRYDTPIQDVYAAIDSWKKSQIDRLDREEDPEAGISFN